MGKEVEEEKEEDIDLKEENDMPESDSETVSAVGRNREEETETKDKITLTILSIIQYIIIQNYEQNDNNQIMWPPLVLICLKISFFIILTKVFRIDRRTD